MKAFEPYDSMKEADAEARAAGKALIAEGATAGPKRQNLIFVKNRLEANAISTVAAMDTEQMHAPIRMNISISVLFTK